MKRLTILDALSAILLMALSALAVHVILDHTLNEACKEADDLMKLHQSWKWLNPDTGDEETVIVETVRGVGQPWEEPVPANETTDAWKARHTANVAATKLACPPITND